MADDDIHEIAIIGGGPSGYTAALYASRADLNPIVIEGYAAGGQLMITSEVDNFPGFPEGIMGPELMQHMRAQAERFGAQYRTEDVTAVRFSDDPLAAPHELDTIGGTIRAHAVVVATGATARQLGLESEARLQGRGVSYCAVCDGAFFKGETIAVVGGGDAAVEEADYLTRYAAKVYVIHRRDQFRASKLLQERLFANPKIEVVWNQRVTEIVGDAGGAKSVQLESTVDGSRSALAVTGVFVFIGFKPNSGLIREHFEHDASGYIHTDDRMMTSIPGLFAAGDLRVQLTRQVTTAVGDATTAVIAVEKYLTERKQHQSTGA